MLRNASLTELEALSYFHHPSDSGHSHRVKNPENVSKKMNQKLPYPCFICGERFKVPSHVGKHVEEFHLENRKKCVCDVCGQVLKTSSGLIKHQKTHRGEKTYQCAFCPESFVQWAQRQRHEKAHIKSDVFQCNECEVFFPRLEMLEDHNLQANCLQVNLFCCKQKFGKRLDYAKHQLNNHRHTRRKRFVEHSCDYCTKSFGTLEDLQDHKKSDHKDLCLKKCPKCNRDVGDVRYAFHIKKCTGRQYNHGGGSFARSNITNNYQPDPAIFKSFCRVCNEEFANQEELLEHRKSHPSKCKTFVCKICGNCCNRGSQTVHYLKHVGEKKFKCDVCDKSFYQKQNLTIHSRTHTKERPYKCKECGKTYAHPSSFREHVIFHSGERPYKCGYCPKAFFRYSGFQSHERTHTGEKPLQCKVCGRCFAVHATLNAHLKRHFNPTMRIRKGKNEYQRNESSKVEAQSVEENWVCEQIPVDGTSTHQQLDYVIIP